MLPGRANSLNFVFRADFRKEKAPEQNYRPGFGMEFEETVFLKPGQNLRARH